MDNLNGKTIRRITQHIPQDSLMKINFRNLNRETIELFDNTYYKHVSYSLKKKNRWMLSTLLSGGDYENDEAIVYSKHQCIEDQKPEKTIYIFDSVLNKQFGSPEVSNRKLSRKSINKTSTMRTIEDKYCYTQKEITEFEKSKRRGPGKSKKSRKNHRNVITHIPGENERLPPKEDYLLDVENRKNCAFVEEYVHLNDLSKINIEKPIHRKRLEMTSFDIDKSKRLKRNFKQCDLTDSDYEWDEDNNDDNDEDFEEAEIVQEDHLIKPYTVSENNFLIRKEKAEKKKRKRKRKYQHFPLANLIVEESKENIPPDIVTESQHIVDISRVILPSIVMNVSMDSFVTDLEVITDLCQCWCSDTSPRSIMIDLENVMESKSKNFIILKPTVIKNPESITIKVLFNVDGLDYDQILERSFTNLRELVEYLQSIRIPDNEAEQSSSREILELDQLIDGLDIIWKTKWMGNSKKIHETHDEWKSYKFNKDDVATMIINIQFEPLTYTWECCEVCFCNFPEDEMITIKKCQHRICEDCLSSHLIYRLETGLENINCPGTDCCETIDCATILSLIPWKQYCKRMKKIENLIMRKNGTTCFCCGNVTLFKGDSLTRANKQLNYLCICGKIVCNLCGKQQHWPSSCYEMKKHIQKLKDLKDVETFSDKCTPMIVQGINCPSCFYFVMKTAGCNHMTCVCGTHFCWLCGDSCDEGIHKLDGFPCNSKNINNQLTFDLTFVVPIASKLRPQLYILSISERIKYFDKRRIKLFRQFNDILNLKLEVHDPTFNSKNLENLFVQLIWLTESIYVKAYQVGSRRQRKLQTYLKGSASMLLYYQNQISLKIEYICCQMKYSHKVNCRKKLQESCVRLIRLFSDLKNYVSHMHIVLQT